MSYSNLDFPQILKKAYDNDTEALKILGVGGSLSPEKFDEIVLTYIVVGDGAGQIGTVVFKLATDTVTTLTLTYNSSNNLIRVVKS